MLQLQNGTYPYYLPKLNAKLGHMKNRKRLTKAGQPFVQSGPPRSALRFAMSVTGVPAGSVTAVLQKRTIKNGRKDSRVS